jgi:hypothetical protein
MYILKWHILRYLWHLMFLLRQIDIYMWRFFSLLTMHSPISSCCYTIFINVRMRRALDIDQELDFTEKCTCIKRTHVSFPLIYSPTSYQYSLDEVLNQNTNVHVN